MMMIMMMRLLEFAVGCYLSEINLDETILSFRPAVTEFASSWNSYRS
jgi:hypothetical protein